MTFFFFSFFFFFFFENQTKSQKHKQNKFKLSQHWKKMSTTPYILTTYPKKQHNAIERSIFTHLFLKNL